ncbi:hypothetical protein [Deinococcus petrolearius]|uniref:TrbL/VirB6 plasmid conjugal transfer protein n=1 Tax=Deinococcus petrolearius TaxID=1751295 RepID=A0ABW1DLY9_9DEIO
MTNKLALALIFLSASLALLNSLASNNRSRLFMHLLMCGLCFGAIKDYGGGGLAWQGYNLLRTGWSAAYSASSTIGQNMLNANFLKDTNLLASKTLEYLAVNSEMRLQRTLQAGRTLNPMESPESLQATYDAVAEEKKRQFSESQSFLGGSLASVGYYLTIGLFSVFGIIIYSSGFLVLIIGIMLPIGVAITSFGRSNLMAGMGVLGLGSVATIAVLPIVVGLVTKAMLTSPIQTLSSSLNFTIDQGRSEITTLSAAVDRCGWDVVCQGKTAATSAVFNAFGIGGDMIIGLGLAFFAVMAAFAVAMTQLRRVPALIMQVIGAGGGGESTGAWQKGKDNFSLPSTGGGKGGAGPSSSGGGGGAVVMQEGKGQALAAGASKVHPAAAVTVKAIQVTNKGSGGGGALPSSGGGPKALPPSK